MGEPQDRQGERIWGERLEGRRLRERRWGGGGDETAGGRLSGGVGERGISEGGIGDGRGERGEIRVEMEAVGGGGHGEIALFHIFDELAQWGVEAVAVQEVDGFGLFEEVGGGEGGEDFVKGADSSFEGYEDVGVLFHHLFAFMEGLDVDADGIGGMLIVEPALGNKADYFGSGVGRGLGYDSHHAVTEAAVDEGMAVAADPGPEIAGVFDIFFCDTRPGRAVNGDSHCWFRYGGCYAGFPTGLLFPGE